ncbi:MAG TPA: Vi polysaccharide biosynthesis UDP-N-acetylglucosamine C-6 dehydrogenase TviB [Ignavibacteriaceae bacterium]|nr:Vi polysaccharide biosynthesis UDP-N-acetylglucosamine C-6 dehydrogenase TviB [Ignavibacteriaceae bacterium]
MELLEKIEKKQVSIGIIGLGYVGLPLAVEFGKIFKVIGFDINEKRIEELNKGFDRTLEVSGKELNESANLCFTSNLNDLQKAEIFIITVPTPVDSFKRPDLTPLLKASETVGKVLTKGNIVIYESTVYPGCTEEDCVPVLEKYSGLKFNIDFYCGYSPERINPGDKEHRVNTIKKIVSGSTPEISQAINKLYISIITAGTHLASSIKVAEAAKVIENAQRDINIAFVNELAMLFDLMGIDTIEVLQAAGTKWNFLPFRPGLVGGHCIGVDPYYLTHKAINLGYNPEIILAGRRINDGMGPFVANKLVKHMIKKGLKINGANVLVLGITFKENCPDIRNSKVIDIISELKEFGCNVDIFDPWADKDEVSHEYGIKLTAKDELLMNKYSGIILAVSHNEFLEIDYNDLKNNGAIVYDVKGILKKEQIDARL